jgi:hypothetical protein
MDFGLHLPLMDFGGHPFTLDHLITYGDWPGVGIQCASCE